MLPADPARLARIDARQFVSRRGILNSVPTNHADQLLLTALISLAHGIGLNVNASDIDSEESLSLLRRLHCDGIRRDRSDLAVPPRKLEGLLR